MGFLEMHKVTNAFLCLPRKSELPTFVSRSAFLGHWVSKEGRAGPARSHHSAACGIVMCLGLLQRTLGCPDLLLDLAESQYEVVWLEGADVLPC